MKKTHSSIATAFGGNLFELETFDGNSHLHIASASPPKLV